jgi:uncharacterized repeat protein (TIGR01451 family)
MEISANSRSAPITDTVEGGEVLLPTKQPGLERSPGRSGSHARPFESMTSVPPMASPADIVIDEDERRARKLAALDRILADAGSFADLPEEHRTPLAMYAGQLATSETPAIRCWAPGTPEEIVRAYRRVEQQIESTGGLSLNALQVGGHWFRTATNGSGQSAQGQPVTLTWSIVPDGTPVSGGVGEPAANSTLRARLAQIYGGSAAGDPRDQPWFAVFQATFDNLAANSGLRFVYEPADDATGIASSSLSGTLGVRGDIRISGHPIDGDFNTLAYAYFPDNGDVVIDTNDSFYNTISNTSIRLRNVLEHEIGHSLGLDHVCPINSTKLMEPSLSTAFRGSQFDDIYSHQRNYGDPLEVHGSLRTNDTPANATALALTTGTQAAWQWLSIDDNSDVDHYSFTGTRNQQVTVRIIPSDPILPDDPVNDTYLEGEQIGSDCTAGTPFDPTTQQDLVLDLLAANGTTVSAAAPAQAAGVTEEIVAFQLPADGTHYIRVRGGLADRAQLYRMEVLKVDAAPAPRLALTATRLDAESNSGTNGAPDPGETVRYGVTLTNEGNLTASGLVATLSAPSGSTLFTATANYGTLVPGAVAERLFTFSVDGTAGDTVMLQLSLAAAGYAEQLDLPLTLGTSSTAVLIDENFDGSAGLPAGWSQSVSGAGSAWVISTNRSNSAPNSAFSPSVTPNGEALLVSPSITAGPDGGVLEFRHQYLLESSRDGGVLEGSRNGGAWFDLMNSAATVEAGDYNGSIANNSSSSIKGRQAWTGSAAAFVTSRVRLPVAWAGESIVFRWRLVHNSVTTITGWNVDDVKFTSAVAVADPFRPFVSLATSATALSESTPAQQAQLTLSTPLPLVQALNVTPVLSGTADAADIGGPLSFTLPAGTLSTAVSRSATADGIAEGTETLVISIPATESGFAPAAPSSVSIQVSDGSAIPATVTLTALNPTYTGSSLSPTVTTAPAGLAVSVTYNGLTQAPTNAGSYAIVATITEPGYTGSASATMVIGKALATVTLGSLSPTYTGTPKAATATTSPAGLAVSFTYDNSSTAPTNAGSYAVVGTVNDLNYQGSANGTLVIVSAYTAWIATYADPGNPAAAASGDLDGDGWDNAGEYAFGTLPNNPSSLPQLQPVLTPTTMMLMVPNPPPGIVLSAETSTGLDNWTTGGVATIPGGFEVARNGPKRFLRIVYEVVN